MKLKDAKPERQTRQDELELHDGVGDKSAVGFSTFTIASGFQERFTWALKPI